MDDILILKKEQDIKLNTLKIKFRYYMGVAEVYAPIFIQSIPAALTIVSIGVLFPSLLHIHPILAWVIAGFVGIGMELLGLVSVDVYFDAKSYNQKYKDELEHAPEGAALIVMLVYAITALLIVVFLKMVPALAIWSLIPLTLMSILIVSAVTMKKRVDELVAQKERTEGTIEQTQLVHLYELISNVQNQNEHLTSQMNAVQMRNEQFIEQLNVLKMNNEHSKSVQVSDKNVQSTPNKNVQKLPKDTKMYMLIEHLIEHYDGVQTDELKPSKIAEQLPLDRITITRYLKELKEQNKLNGHVNAYALR